MFQEEKSEVVLIYLDDIIPNRFQPRVVFDERSLKELAVSIKEHGVIEPIIVRRVNNKYEIIAGERRWKASALAGLTKIPAIIRDLDDKESSKVALLENLQRKNLNPIEEARTYQKILEIDQMTQEALAKTMGKSQSAVANKLRLLSLPDEIQEALLKEKISERHARALLNLTDEDEQKSMLKRIVDEKLSVRNLEEEIKRMKGDSQEPIEENIPSVSSEPTNLTASALNFVNDSPLVPTAELPKEKSSDYGVVKIAPPEGEESPMGKFINYGEIGQEEKKPDVPQISQTAVDINKVKESAKSIKPEINNKQSNNTNRNGSAIDSLLNLNAPVNMNPANYITPAEKIVKADPYANIDKKSSEDYFKASDLSSVNLPADLMAMNQFGNANYTMEEAKSKVRELINDLRDHGIKISSDEMDFSTTYQIIIKIEKED